VVALGIFLPLSPLAGVLGFDPLPVPFFLALLGMVVVYLVLVEAAKQWFFARDAQQLPAPPPPVRRRQATHHISRRAFRFSIPVKVPPLRVPAPGVAARKGRRHGRRHEGTARP
jgi:Mg2+-importing ATPase